MLAHEPEESLAGPVSRPPAGNGWTASPDREVLDTARFRLSSRDGGPVADPLLSRALEDLRAVATVRMAARYGAQPPAGPLDLGAGLVLLANLRLYLDTLEADLLDAAARLGMSWDLIAAIIGLPADDARDRLRDLQAHPDPH